MQNLSEQAHIDQTKPDGKWEFDRAVASCFADMLERSIPDYRSMRSLVYELGSKYIVPGAWITDIGCSTGLAVEPFYQKCGSRNKYYLVDNSDAMLDQCKDNFSVGVKQGFVTIVNGNFYEVPMPSQNSLVLSILSLQFMPTAYRQKIINDIYEALLPGGAFILVEKVIGDDGMDEVLVDSYYDMKRLNGYSDTQIMEKRKALENVLSPLKAEWNVDMLQEAGFSNIDCFWRCPNFCGWIAIK